MHRLWKTCVFVTTQTHNYITRNLKVIWEELRRHPSRQRTTTPRSPHCNQWDAPHLPSKLFIPLRPSPPPSTFVDRPHSPPKRHPDPISRFATVHFPDRQTDTWDKRQVYSKIRLRLIVSDTANNDDKSGLSQTTCATCCRVTPIVYIQVYIQCDKLTTVVG